MGDAQINHKVINATKWSSIAELLSKIVVPITNMILARLLTPEAFGVIATITMILSFIEILTDAGLQKYLIQRDFVDEYEKQKHANVAFWTNFTLSIILWGLVAILNERIATALGNPGLGLAIVVSFIQLPLTAFSSIQTGLFKRDFDFKTLFKVRLLGLLVPFTVTIPLAMFGLGFWSLIIGMIILQLMNTVVLLMKSNWKPTLTYDFKILKQMTSFSVWSLIESVSIWFTTWIDTFVIVYFLSRYYLGIYKTSTMMVSSLLSLITAVTIPILFSALSRLQNEDQKFKEMFYKFQRVVSVLIIPLGVWVFLYREFVTNLMLGSQWGEASDVIGIWALTSVVMVVFGNLSSEVYRARGRPKLSFLAQIMHLTFLVPTCVIFAKYGFWPLVIARSLIRMQFVIVHLVMMKCVMKFSIRRMFINTLPGIIASLVMGLAGFVLGILFDVFIWDVITFVLTCVIYVGVLGLFPKVRKDISNLMSFIIRKMKTKTS